MVLNSPSDVERDLQAVLSELQGQQQHARNKHGRSSSQGALNPGSLSLLSACRSGPLASATDLQGNNATASLASTAPPSVLGGSGTPLSSSLNSLQQQKHLPTSKDAQPHTQQPKPLSLDPRLSRSLGSARSILTGSNEALSAMADCSSPTADQHSSLLAGKGDTSLLGRTADTSILSRLQLHAPHASTNTSSVSSPVRPSSPAPVQTHERKQDVPVPSSTGAAASSATQPPSPQATTSQHTQHTHRRALSMCAAVLTGAIDTQASSNSATPTALQNSLQHLQHNTHQHSQQQHRPVRTGRSLSLFQDSHGSLSLAEQQQQQGLQGLLHAAATAAAAAAAAQEQQRQQQGNQICQQPASNTNHSTQATATPSTLSLPSSSFSPPPPLSYLFRTPSDTRDRRMPHTHANNDSYTLPTRTSDGCMHPHGTSPLPSSPPAQRTQSCEADPAAHHQQQQQALLSPPQALSPPPQEHNKHQPTGGSIPIPYPRHLSLSPRTPPSSLGAPGSVMDDVPEGSPSTHNQGSPSTRASHHCSPRASQTTHSLLARSPRSANRPAPGHLPHSNSHSSSGGYDLPSPSLLHGSVDRVPHTSSTRPHSRRTTSSGGGAGSLMHGGSKEESEGTRQRTTRDRRHISDDTHPLGHSHHHHSRSASSSLAATAMPMNAGVSNASSRMATNAATQRHRCPAAPVGTTAAVAAMTGRPHSERESTPRTSTAAMMGGFNSISHARVRSIDLATDYLLGGRGSRGNNNNNEGQQGSRLQHQNRPS